jgi:hypothetical protein
VRLLVCYFAPDGARAIDRRSAGDKDFSPRRKWTFRLPTARDLQRNADSRKGPGRARDGSLGQSGAAPQEPETRRIISAPAGAQGSLSRRHSYTP